MLACFLCVLILIEVTVSLPDLLTVGEGDGIVQVCVILSATNVTAERNFTVTLATIENTGTLNQLLPYHRMVKYSVCN